MNIHNVPMSKINHTAIIVVLAMLTAFAPFATDTYLPGFPAIAESLKTSTQSLQWSLSIFFLGLSVGQLFYGPLTERWGRRIPLLVGVTIFLISSVLIMFVDDVELFIGLRLVQAIGGCSGMVISRIIIQDLFDQKRSAQALSTMMVIQGIGPILAPISGGFILSHFSWQYIFLALAAFSLLCLIMTLRYVPETLPRHKTSKISVDQIIKGFSSLISEKIFVIPCIMGALAVSVMFTFIATSPELFMTIYQLNETQYEFAFGGIALGIAVFSQINSLLLKSFTPTQILSVAVGASVVFSAVLLFSLFLSSLVLTMIPLFFCVGMVPLIAANSTAIAMSTFPEEAGLASSLVGVIQFGLGFICSTLPGLFGGKNILAMGIVILGCFALSLVLFFYDRNQRSTVTIECS
jgi:MFS transporter, DHA1 family, multidrug resistance protein